MKEQDKISFIREEDRKQIEEFKKDFLKDPNIVKGKLQENSMASLNKTTAVKLGIIKPEDIREKE